MHYSIVSNGFNTKAAMAHHPIFQKEVDELLAKGATELFAQWCLHLLNHICSS